jgi:hypothetical protein
MRIFTTVCRMESFALRPNWNLLVAGVWENDKRPFATAFKGHLGRMTVGSIQGGKAQIQRYSDW